MFFQETRNSQKQIFEYAEDNRKEMKNIFTLKDLDVKNQRVLVRVDFNVQLDKKGNITSDKRIRAALPTIKYLIKHKAMIILISHLGRPEGKIVDSLKMDKIAKMLQALLKKKVYKLDDCIGQDIEDFIDKMVLGEVVLLENIRFYKEEENNDRNFSSSLADLADIYVNDAFGTAHRKHASVCGITKYIPSAAGLLLQKEIETLGEVMQKPKKPFIAILGGAKVSDKIGVINSLLKKVDKLLIGGAMAYTFFKAQGHKTGKCPVEENKIPLAKKLLKNKKIILPVDNIIGDSFEPDANKKAINSDEIPDKWEGLDIGPKTIKIFKKHLKKAKTIVWNGSLGVAEWPRFRKGTAAIVKVLAKSRAKTIIGGGDTTALVDQLHLEDKMSYVSTGGGAFLEFFEGKKLPAITALEKNYKKFK